jgi:hypothetical protein
LTNNVLLPAGGVGIVFAGSCFNIKLIFYLVVIGILPDITLIYHFFNLTVFTTLRRTP